MRNRSRAGLAALLLVASCSDDGSSSSSVPADTKPTTTAAATTTTEAVPGYSAEITRTEYGIPHIVADDWGSLGFGQGYAYSQDRACTLLDQIIKVRGERAAWFGPGEGDANINSDFAYRHLGLWADADQRFGDQSERVEEMVSGYVAGFNAALAAEGAHGWWGKPGCSRSPPPICTPTSMTSPSSPAPAT